MNYILKTTLFLSLLTILLVAMGGAIGGQRGMIVAFLMAAVMNFGSYWFSDKIVHWMYNFCQFFREEQAVFCGVFQQLTRRASLPSPNGTSFRMTPPIPLPQGAITIMPLLLPQKASCVFSIRKNSRALWHMDLPVSKTARYFFQTRPLVGAHPVTDRMFTVNPLTGGGLMSFLSTHPLMEERIARLELLAG